MVYPTLLSLNDHTYFDSVVLYVWATVSVLWVSGGPLVVVETLLEWHGSKSSVLLFIASLHECFVQKRSCMASTIQWATILLSSPASHIRWVFWSLLSITEDLVVVPFDDCSHVWHTTVAQHQSVPVEDCVQLRVLREMLASLRPKPSADVDGYITVVGWVEASLRTSKAGGSPNFTALQTVGPCRCILQLSDTWSADPSARV